MFHLLLVKLTGRSLFNNCSFTNPSSFCSPALDCPPSSSGSGEDQEPGEDVAGAALAGHDGVVDHRDQGHRVPGLQLQQRRARGDEEALRRVAHGDRALLALHQLQTHLSGNIHTRVSSQQMRSRKLLQAHTYIHIYTNILTPLLAKTW